MSIYMSSDFHLGHKVITKYRPIFATQEEHDQHILDEMSKLNKRDILYVLGDFIFDSDKYDWYVEQIKKMPCRVKLTLGNHCSRKLYREDRFEVQLPLFTYKEFWMTHAPIHPDEIRGRKGVIHGHCHTNKVRGSYPDFKEDYYNVVLDQNDFKFLNFEQIVEEYKRRNK